MYSICQYNVTIQYNNYSVVSFPHTNMYMYMYSSSTVVSTNNYCRCQLNTTVVGYMFSNYYTILIVELKSLLLLCGDILLTYTVHV